MAVSNHILLYVLLHCIFSYASVAKLGRWPDKSSMRLPQIILDSRELN